ncbi:MAG: hypothetical protein COZ56_10435 [Armatimonadetes bacterium CG_4_8_14_3_um_filter_58_9]|nr:MAG: hypothetical protein COZ56_10435 [Armatimonadetes bacterium CG_4_8_14_3_um_filter_58_9]
MIEAVNSGKGRTGRWGEVILTPPKSRADRHREIQTAMESPMTGAQSTISIHAMRKMAQRSPLTEALLWSDISLRLLDDAEPRAAADGKLRTVHDLCPYR